MDLPPIMCIQCGKGPLGIKVIGPTIGFFVTVAVGVSRICSPMHYMADMALHRYSAGRLRCFAAAARLIPGKGEIFQSDKHITHRPAA